MSIYSNAGELQTAIVVENKTEVSDDEGFKTTVWQNIFGNGKTVRCRWINYHGTDIFTEKSLGYKDGATITMRYSPKITSTCRIIRCGDSEPYNVISVDNIRQRGLWCELKIMRGIGT